MGVEVFHDMMVSLLEKITFSVTKQTTIYFLWRRQEGRKTPLDL